MIHEKFTVFITDAERRDLKNIAQMLHQDETACVSEAIRRFIVYYSHALKSYYTLKSTTQP